LRELKAAVALQSAHLPRAEVSPVAAAGLVRENCAVGAQGVRERGADAAAVPEVVHWGTAH